jgi:hypothetical protein
MAAFNSIGTKRVLYPPEIIKGGSTDHQLTLLYVCNEVVQQEVETERGREIAFEFLGARRSAHALCLFPFLRHAVSGGTLLSLLLWRCPAPSKR